MKTTIEEHNKALDPIAVYAAVSGEGTKPDTLLFESAAVVTRKGQRSLVMAAAALKIVCNGLAVTVTALSKNGVTVLPAIKKKLARFLVHEEKNLLQLQFLPIDTKKNLADRLLESSPLDVLRVVSEIVKPKKEHAHLMLLAGVFSYDFVDVFEALPEAKTDELGFPNYVFWLPEVLVHIDHIHNKTVIASHAFGGESVVMPDLLQHLESGVGFLDSREEPESNKVTVDISDTAFADIILTLKKRIVLGDVFQIVPSRTFQAPCRNPLAAYRRLHANEPSPYMFYVAADDFTLFGASPEIFIKISGEPKTVEIHPIAGTRRRGLDPDLDSRRETELRLNEKELAEHMMLVDLARNDVARVSNPNSRRVEKLLTVERYSHVMHLVSQVAGDLKPELDALHAYQASLNMGTLVGAPKVKAAEILRQTERTKRGTYGGAVGYLASNGELDTAIVIRSALVKEGVAYVRTGAGIVYDSDPQDEVEETKAKARAVLQAITR